MTGSFKLAVGLWKTSWMRIKEMDGWNGGWMGTRRTIYVIFGVKIILR